MARRSHAWNCVSYLWWSLAFGVIAAVLACFFIPLSSSPDSLTSHLDERALYVVGTILELPATVCLVVSCVVISKEQPEKDKTRHRFVRIILLGLIIFALVTVANCVVQLMADIQLQIRSSASLDLHLHCLNRRSDNFHECNCVSYTVIIHHVVKLLFASMQTIFLYLFASKRLKHRFWLQLMMATVLIGDIYLAVWSLIFKFRQEQFHDANKESPLFPDFPGVPYPLKDTCQKLGDSAFLYKFRVSVIQWLYPLQTEFFLCASGMFLSVWLNLPEDSKTAESAVTYGSGFRSTIRDRAWTSTTAVDHKIRKYSCGTVVITIIGAFLAVGLAVSNLVRGLVPCSTRGCLNDSVADPIDNGNFSLEDAMIWDGSQWVAHHTLTLVVTLIILLELVCRHERGHGHFGLDMRVLGVFLPIVLVPIVMEIIAAGYFTPTKCVPWLHAQLTIASNTLAIADALLQTALVFYGSQFSHNHRRDSQPAVFTERTHLNGSSPNFCITKHLLLFLAICDLPIWLDRSLEALNSQIQTYSAPSQYFDPDVWLNIVSCINPILALFYFHLFACLCELFVSFTPKRSNTHT